MRHLRRTLLIAICIAFNKKFLVLLLLVSIIFVSACNPIAKENCSDNKIELIQIPPIVGEFKYGVYPLQEKFASTKDIPIQPGRLRDLAINEFLLRRAMAEYGDISEWYINLDRLGVSDTFLERFSDIPLNIYPISSAYSDYSGKIFNRKTHENGVQAIAEISRWIDDDTAEVEYGHYIHSQGAIFYRGKVKLQEDMWVFKLEGSRVF